MRRSRRRLLTVAGGGFAACALHGVAAFAQSPRFRDADRTRDKIVALVRAFADRDARALLHIQKIDPVTDLVIPGVKAKPEHLPLVDYFVGDLHLRYSFDDPKHISSVNADDLKRLKLKREELLPLAIANFRRLYPKLKVERLKGHVSSVTEAGELEPSLMLDAAFWNQERERARSEIIAAVPARDALVFSNRSVTSNVEVLKAVANDVYETAGPSALSRRLFLWNQGRWEVFG